MHLIKGYAFVKLRRQKLVYGGCSTVGTADTGDRLVRQSHGLVPFWVQNETALKNKDLIF